MQVAGSEGDAGLLRLAECDEQSQMQARAQSRMGQDSRPSIFGQQLRMRTTLGLLTEQPGFCLGCLAENPDNAKVGSRHHLEHPHHAEHGIAGSHNGTNSKLSLLTNQSQFGVDGPELAALRQPITVTDVQHDIEAAYAEWV
jgi:hypothetical protein